jgi:hypothetical protein
MLLVCFGICFALFVYVAFKFFDIITDYKR